MPRKMELPSKKSQQETMKELVRKYLIIKVINTISCSGQYSYIDENGNEIVVKYSAGVNGFRYNHSHSHINTVP